MHGMDERNPLSQSRGFNWLRAALAFPVWALEVNHCPWIADGACCVAHPEGQLKPGGPVAYKGVSKWNSSLSPSEMKVIWAVLQGVLWSRNKSHYENIISISNHSHLPCIRVNSSLHVAALSPALLACSLISLNGERIENGASSRQNSKQGFNKWGIALFSIHLIWESICGRFAVWYCQTVS